MLLYIKNEYDEYYWVDQDGAIRTKMQRRYFCDDEEISKEVYERLLEQVEKQYLNKKPR